MNLTRDDLQLPNSATLFMGARVGRFCSAVIGCTLAGSDVVLVLDELPNYHYVGDGEIELLGMSTVSWGEEVVRLWRRYAGDSYATAWVDEKTDFQKDLARCKLRLKLNDKSMEIRTEITREYFNLNKVRLAPWLDVLPTEIERARWPPEESSKGHVRDTGQDYTLSALEQIISRRPRARYDDNRSPSNWKARYLAENKIRGPKGDPHFGFH